MVDPALALVVEGRLARYSFHAAERHLPGRMSKEMIMLLRNERRRRRPIWPCVLLTGGGTAITVGGALALNFDVLILGIGCLVAGITGFRRHEEDERQPWNG